MGSEQARSKSYFVADTARQNHQRAYFLFRSATPRASAIVLSGGSQLERIV
jgi:hypothetical protein